MRTMYVPCHFETWNGKTETTKNIFYGTSPLYSKKTKIDKSKFEFDLFWSIKDGALIEIDTLINVYSQYSNTKNMKALVSLFGKERVVNVMEQNKQDNPAYKNNIEIINDTTTKNFTAKNLAPFII